MNFERGVLCNLTGKVADFDLKGCPNYKTDFTEKEICIRKAKEILKESYPETNLMNDLLSLKSYKSSEKINIRKVEIEDGKKIIESNKNEFIIAFLFGLGVFVYNIYLHFEEVKTFSIEILFLLSTGVLIILSIGYFAFIKKHKNNEMIIDENKVKFIKFSLFDDKTESTIYWNEIAEFGVLTTPHKNGNIEEVLIRSFSGKEILIHPKTYKTSLERILEILKNRQI
ncbi:hypothetical protein Q4595_15990 [Wenyingzhuangia sp. 1_MG-2023]|nr:hypothetical protein [Wenyingzhuangia sp. 1_MG-2023]